MEMDSMELTFLSQVGLVNILKFLGKRWWKLYFWQLSPKSSSLKLTRVALISNKLLKIKFHLDIGPETKHF